jgi:TonB family protein
MRRSLAVVALAVILSAARCAGQKGPIYDDPDETAGFTTPVPIAGVAPHCAAPKVMNRTGRIWVRLVVNADGSAQDVRLLKSEVSDVGCDDAVVQAFKQWRFKPSQKDGRPVRVRITTGSAYPFEQPTPVLPAGKSN